MSSCYLKLSEVQLSDKSVLHLKTLNSSSKGIHVKFKALPICKQEGEKKKKLSSMICYYSQSNQYKAQTDMFLEITILLLSGYYFKKRGGLPNPQLLVLLMLCRMFSLITIFIRKGDEKVMTDFMAREYSKKQD